jgi:Mlc titration factor MtfA (ptsG expression regulator)
VQLWHQGVSAAEINSRAADLRRERLTRNAKDQERQIKVSVILGEVTHQALALARISDGIPAAERVRAALHQWQQDPQFRAAVDELAAELRRQRFADRAAADSSVDPPDLARSAS